MTSYSLPSWIYLCFTQDGAVFLDVKRDRYVGLERSKGQVLRRLLEAQCADSETDALAGELVASGLLTVLDDRSRPIAVASVEAPDNVLVDGLDESPRPSLLHVAAFVSSCVTVWAHLHVGSLERALARLQRRKARLLRSKTPNNAGQVRELTSIFVYLRTFAYTAQEHCLYDSLVLSDYLQRFRIISTCVFGVRTLPFGAHCWVQTDKSLLTEASVEYVAAFSPILVI